MYLHLVDVEDLSFPSSPPSPINPLTGNDCHANLLRRPTYSPSLKTPLNPQMILTKTLLTMLSGHLFPQLKPTEQEICPPIVL